MNCLIDIFAAIFVSSYGAIVADRHFILLSRGDLRLLFVSSLSRLHPPIRFSFPGESSAS